MQAKKEQKSLIKKLEDLKVFKKNYFTVLADLKLFIFIFFFQSYIIM